MIVHVLGSIGAVALLVVAALHAWRYGAERARVRQALSHCRRDAEGNVYVRDPQKGTWHRLDNLLVERAIGEVPSTSPRHRRKVRRHIKQALGAR